MKFNKSLIMNSFLVNGEKIVISTLSNWKTVKKNATARKERPNSHFDPVILYLETAPSHSSTGPWSFISPEARNVPVSSQRRKWFPSSRPSRNSIESHPSV
jgi:hypothetical protein